MCPFRYARCVHGVHGVPAVLVAGPLGLCFLPAFVCLGIVPVVIGLADGMLPGVLP